MRYKRILIKLSGGAVAGNSEFGFDPERLNHIADEIQSVVELGVQVSLVIGGGNIFRGNMAESWGIERAEADNIGTLATVVNSLMLRGVLKARTRNEVRVMTAIPITSVAEPYIRLRAIHHLEKGYIVIFAGRQRPAFRNDGLPVRAAGDRGELRRAPRRQAGCRRRVRAGSEASPRCEKIQVASL
jgi:uridylate kinase